MALPNAAVTLTVEQIDQLNRKLSDMRHDVNNHLSLLVAAAEIVKLQPQMAERMSATFQGQPPRIAEEIRKFSSEWEAMMGITRP